MFSGGLIVGNGGGGGGVGGSDSANTKQVLTVIHGKSTTVLEMEHDIIDFITLCESPYEADFNDPYAIVVLLSNDLVVVNLQQPGLVSKLFFFSFFFFFFVQQRYYDNNFFFNYSIQLFSCLYIYKKKSTTVILVLRIHIQWIYMNHR